MQHILDFDDDFARSAWDASRRAREEAIEIIYDENRQQNIARFNWLPGERANNGLRVELCDPRLPPKDQFIYYRYAMFIPQDFPIETDGYVVISQWHTPGSGHKPPLALRLRHTGRLDVTLNHDKVGANITPGKSGQIMLAQIHDFQKGQWNEFEYLIRWTDKASGHIKMKINQKTVAQYVGKTNYTGQTSAPYFKYGIYPADGNAFELTLDTAPYMWTEEPDEGFLTSRNFRIED